MAASPTGLPSDVLSKVDQAARFPSFADVPSPPKDVRPAAAWRSAVVAVQEAGVRATRMATATPWSLAASDAWAARARAEATPPAPVTTPADPETEALIAAMRARASEPPRRR